MTRKPVKLAYNKIKDMIINQELLPGQQIVESDFAQKLEVSRTPVRSALRLLSEDGLVEIVPNKGTFVKSFTKNDVIYCFEMAEALEGMAAFLLAEQYKAGNVDKSNLSALERLLFHMEESLETGDLAEWSSSDEEFHNSITRLCRNHYIQEEYARLRLQLNCVLWFITPAYINKDASNKEHRQIVKYILEKDPDNARRISQGHRNRVRNDLIELFYGGPVPNSHMFLKTC
jgi:DNA-binding GntR family transcriptional regulator